MIIYPVTVSIRRHRKRRPEYGMNRQGRYPNRSRRRRNSVVRFHPHYYHQRYDASRTDSAWRQKSNLTFPTKVQAPARSLFQEGWPPRHRAFTKNHLNLQRIKVAINSIPLNMKQISLPFYGFCVLGAQLRFAHTCRHTRSADKALYVNVVLHSKRNAQKWFGDRQL